MAGLMQVLIGKGGGEFKKAEVLKGTDGEPLIIPADDEKNLTDKICTRPFAVDWNGDGQLDLVVGNFIGTFFWFKGLGKGKFEPKPEQILVDGKPLKISGVHSDPIIVDWDGDGDLDIVSGSSDGSIVWAENTAGKDKPPVLKAFKTLVSKGVYADGSKMVGEENLSRPNYGVRVWVDDINGDGKLDLIAGDQVTLVTPAKGLSADEVTKKLKDWDAEYKKASDAIQELSKQNPTLKKKDKDKEKEQDKEKEKEDKKAAEEFAKTQQKAYEELNLIYNKRGDIIKEEVTGFVWVYLQK